MAFKLFIEQDPPQIRVTAEANAEHIPDLPFEPSGGRENTRNGGNRSVGIGAHLDHEAPVLGRAEKLVDHFETGIAIGKINCANVDQYLELAAAVVAQKVQNPGDGVPLNGEDELALFLTRGQDAVGHGRRHMITKVLKRLFHHRVVALSAFAARKTRAASVRTKLSKDGAGAANFLL